MDLADKRAEVRIFRQCTMSARFKSQCKAFPLYRTSETVQGKAIKSNLPAQMIGLAKLPFSGPVFFFFFFFFFFLN